MRVLFLGDIVGKAGRKILSAELANIRAAHSIDAVVANAENAAGGNGISKKMSEELFRAGVDAITLGDHVWDQRCFESEIDQLEKVCRPANLPPNNPGRDYVILQVGDKKLAVFSLLGQTLMKIKADCPFRKASEYAEKLSSLADWVLLDFHAETTSEKVCMGYHMDGKISAVVGTHTHIPTADARIFKGGTAFLTDAGMTGPWDSCLGRTVEPILSRFIDGRPRHFLVAEGDVRICGCIIDFDDSSKKSLKIEQFQFPPFGEEYVFKTAEAEKDSKQATASQSSAETKEEYADK